MSWIIGFIGASLSRERRERLVSFCGDPIHESAGNSHYVSIGGIPETSLSGELPDVGRRWGVSGTGVVLEDARSRLLRPQDWRQHLSPPSPQLGRIGGGYLAIRWTSAQVEAFSDPLGLRTLFWTRLQDGFAFSTRLDWLSSLRNGALIDYAAFGSHWLAFNQLGYRCLARDIHRLHPGGFLNLRSDTYDVGSAPWTPSPTREFPGALLQYFLAPRDDRMQSLGLSGGLDSRALLALRPHASRFGVHTFGPRSRPDVRVALAMAERVGVRCSHIDESAPPAEELWEGVRRHAIMAQAVSPASASLFLRHYEKLRAQRKLVVDGGFGEILRRQFMNRLRWRGTLAGDQAPDILEHIKFDRANFFVPDVNSEMSIGAEEDLRHLLDGMPQMTSQEDFIDLLAIRTRLPNFFGFEQARLDTKVQSYMPYAQPSVLDAVFAVPPSKRKGGKIARELIRRHDPLLRKFPLVKGGVAYPYWLRSSAASLFVILRSRLQRQVESESAVLLKILREPVLDRIHSQTVKTCSAYDYELVRSRVEGFYKTGSGAAQVDWWLAFDLWREAIEEGRSTLG